MTRQREQLERVSRVERGQIMRRHCKAGQVPTCMGCGETFPCPTVRLVHELEKGKDEPYRLRNQVQRLQTVLSGTRRDAGVELGKANAKLDKALRSLVTSQAEVDYWREMALSLRESMLLEGDGPTDQGEPIGVLGVGDEPLDEVPFVYCSNCHTKHTLDSKCAPSLPDATEDIDWEEIGTIVSGCMFGSICYLPLTSAIQDVGILDWDEVEKAVYSHGARVPEEPDAESRGPIKVCAGCHHIEHCGDQCWCGHYKE